MTKKIKLYHHSRASSEEIEEIKKKGLSSDAWRVCVGGQREGFYFFTNETFAKRWAMSGSIVGYLCLAQIAENDIRYPDWQLDLFFNNSVIDKAAKCLKKKYIEKANKNGFVALSMKSSIAVDESSDLNRDYCFSKRAVKIDGLKFENGNCIVLYHEKNEKQCFSAIELSGSMKRENLGIADTLIEHLCKEDKNFLSYYEQTLYYNVSSSFYFGAIKCVKPQNISVFVKPYDEFNNQLYSFLWILGYLIQAYSELKNRASKLIIKKFQRNYF